jgi:hypothetical protein
MLSIKVFVLFCLTAVGALFSAGLEDMPNEVREHIAQFLSAESKNNLALVSKNWRDRMRSFQKTKSVWSKSAPEKFFVLTSLCADYYEREEGGKEPHYTRLKDLPTFATSDTYCRAIEDLLASWSNLSERTWHNMPIDDALRTVLHSANTKSFEELLRQCASKPWHKLRKEDLICFAASEHNFFQYSWSARKKDIGAFSVADLIFFACKNRFFQAKLTGLSQLPAYESQKAMDAFVKSPLGCALAEEIQAEGIQLGAYSLRMDHGRFEVCFDPERAQFFSAVSYPKLFNYVVAALPRYHGGETTLVLDYSQKRANDQTDGLPLEGANLVNNTTVMARSRKTGFLSQDIVENNPRNAWETLQFKLPHFYDVQLVYQYLSNRMLGHSKTIKRFEIDLPEPQTEEHQDRQQKMRCEIESFIADKSSWINCYPFTKIALQEIVLCSRGNVLCCLQRLDSGSWTNKISDKQSGQESVKPVKQLAHAMNSLGI